MLCVGMELVDRMQRVARGRDGSELEVEGGQRVPFPRTSPHVFPYHLPLHYVQVFQAGHMVPQDQPEAAWTVLNAILLGNEELVTKAIPQSDLPVNEKWRFDVAGVSGRYGADAPEERDETVFS